MKNKIEYLLNDSRLDGLMITPEFMDARFRLTKMQELLKNGDELSPRQKDYLQRLEVHIKNIHPHFEVLTVNGENLPVHFITESSHD